MTAKRANGFASYLSLFGSLSTLACCALPSLLVLLGLGATVASLLSAAPWLVAVSRHKLWVFLFSGFLITVNFLYLYFVAPRLSLRAEACPTDQPAACDTASRVSRAVLWVSAPGFILRAISSPIFLGQSS